jgi:hypothetical protein
VRGMAGRGSGVEKNPKPVPRPAQNGLAKIQTVPSNINVKTGRGGEVHAGRCGFARFCPPLIAGVCPILAARHSTFWFEFWNWFWLSIPSMVRPSIFCCRLPKLLVHIYRRKSMLENIMELYL